jgi:hypothetical protein
VTLPQARPICSSITSTTAYNQYREPTQTTHELGNVRTFNYDVNFSPQSVTDGVGTLSTFIFNNDGTIQAGAIGYDISANPSKASQFTYDSNGNMASRRVRFMTAAALVDQLVEAQREQSLSRMLARWSRVELIVIDELGYVPLAEVAAELLFQIIAERAEKAAVIVTTNLPFSEWPQVFTNARLCKAVLDRLTDQAHIIETGSESYRFRRTLRKNTKE